MVDERGRYPHLTVVQYDARAVEIVDAEQRRQRHAPFVGDSRFDVCRVERKKLRCHPGQRRRPPAIDRRLEAGRPGQEEQVAIVRVVIRVMMRDEDVADRSQRHIRRDQLPRDAVPAIDDVRRVVDAARTESGTRAVAGRLRCPGGSVVSEGPVSRGAHVAPVSRGLQPNEGIRDGA
jgi:hypothetical protein